MPGISTAQKVRLWFILGLSVIQLIAIIVILTLPEVKFFGVMVMNGTDVGDATAWIALTFIANVVLGTITLHRFLRPKLHFQPQHTFHQPYGDQNPYTSA